MKWGLLAGIGLGTLAGMIYAQQKKTGKTRNIQRVENRETAAAARRGFREGISGVEDPLASGRHDFLTIVNEWPHERLIAIDGIGPVLATKIIAHRPYKTPQELVNSKLLPPSAIEALRLAS